MGAWKILEIAASGTPSIRIKTVENHNASPADAYSTAQISDLIYALEERYALAQQAAGFGVWDWDTVTGQLVWDREMHALFGTDPTAWTNSYSGFADQLDADELAECERRIEHSKKTGEPYRYEFVTKSGRVISGIGKVYFNGTIPVRMVGVCLLAHQPHVSVRCQTPLLKAS